MAVVYQQSPVQSMTAEFVYNTPDISTGVAIGVVPIGARILDAFVYVEEAFNAVGTDYLRIGTTAGGTNLAVDTDVSVAGRIQFTGQYALNPLVANRTIYIRYVGSGGAPTTGRAHVVILWSY